MQLESQQESPQQQEQAQLQDHQAWACSEQQLHREQQPVQLPRYPY